MKNITTEKTSSKFGLECRRIYKLESVDKFHCCFVHVFYLFPSLFISHGIEIEEMSPAVTKNKKRKATEIDANESKEEQVAKAKKADSGERKYWTLVVCCKNTTTEFFSL